MAWWKTGAPPWTQADPDTFQEWQADTLQESDKVIRIPLSASVWSQATVGTGIIGNQFLLNVTCHHLKLSVALHFSTLVHWNLEGSFRNFKCMVSIMRTTGQKGIGFRAWWMLWKCCTQYASKFGKLSSGHRTEEGQFSFQSQRKAMPKNAQTTTQLHSSHMLVK